MSETFLIRSARVADAAVLGAMRAASHGERHERDPADVARFAETCTAFFTRELGSAKPFVHAWLAFAPDRVDEALGTAALSLVPTLPRLGASGPELDARVRNVYVVPGARRRGIARALMRTLMSDVAGLGIARLTLGSSKQGRPLYEALGFVPNGGEMVFEAG